MLEQWLGVLRRSGIGVRLRQALALFHANEFDQITGSHIRSVATTSFLTLGQSHRLTEPATFLHPNDRAGMRRNGFDPNLLLNLIKSIKAADFAVNLACAAQLGKLSLPSPFRSQEAICQESYEAAFGLNSLRFVDGDRSFFLLQRVTSADGIYFPAENIVIGLSYLEQFHIDRLNRVLVEEFVDNVAYARREKTFGGLIASHSRPAHNYFEILPDLVEFWRDGSEPRVPLLQRHGHDFLDLARLFPDSERHLLSTKQLRNRSRERNEWFLHIGTSRQLRGNGFSYDATDRYLIEKANASPMEHAIAKSEVLSGCSPVVWIGVEGQRRSWIEQVDGLASLVSNLARRYPNLGVVIDGWTLPLSHLGQSSARVNEDNRIVKELRKRLPAKLPAVTLVGETGMTKIFVGQRADFFVTNFSSGSLYISRVLGKPGFCHISNALAEHSLKSENQYHPNRKVYLLHRDLVRDVGIVASGQSPANAQVEFNSAELGAVSYSIDPEQFTEFVESRVEGILAHEPSAMMPRLFIEPPNSVPHALRRLIRGPNFGNWLQVFPSQSFPKEIADLRSLDPEHLKRLMIYGNFSFGGHEILQRPCDYLVWMCEPAKRTRRHLGQLLAARSARGADATFEAIQRAKPLTIDNQLTRQISGVRAPFGECNQDMLQRAIENLHEHFIFIGMAEDLPGSFDRLCRAMDWDRALFVDIVTDKEPVETETSLLELSIDHLIEFDVQLLAAARTIVANRDKP